jgi:hypothetical protein
MRIRVLFLVLDLLGVAGGVDMAWPLDFEA